MSDTNIEPWLRGTHTELDAVTRAVLHALELADEDVSKWCATLTDAEFNARPFGIPPLSVPSSTAIEPAVSVLHTQRILISLGFVPRSGRSSPSPSHRRATTHSSYDFDLPLALCTSTSIK